MPKSALLLIDLQKEGGNADGSMTNIAGEGMGRIVDRAGSLLSWARATHVPVIYTRHVNRADGHGLVNREPVDADGSPLYYRSGTQAVEIIDAIRPQTGDIVVDKRRQSAFFETELDFILRGLGCRSSGGVRRSDRLLRIQHGAGGLRSQLCAHVDPRCLWNDLPGRSYERRHDHGELGVRPGARLDRGMARNPARCSEPDMDRQDLRRICLHAVQHGGGLRQDRGAIARRAHPRSRDPAAPRRGA